MLIAKFNTNLVRLYGCYIEQGEKVLLYKHMPNKSLDFFPFGVCFYLFLIISEKKNIFTTFNMYHFRL